MKTEQKEEKEKSCEVPPLEKHVIVDKSAINLGRAGGVQYPGSVPEVSRGIYGKESP